MEKEEIAKKLMAAAERRAATQGVQFGPGAYQDIRNFANRSAERMVSDAGANNESVATAEAAFEKLVDGMVSAASEIAGYKEAHPGVIGEHTLADALPRLRPLYPIC